MEGIDGLLLLIVAVEMVVAGFGLIDRRRGFLGWRKGILVVPFFLIAPV